VRSATIAVEGPFIYLRTSYESADLCRSLPGRTWDKARRQWRIPASPEGARNFYETFSGFQIKSDPAVDQLLCQAQKNASAQEHKKVDPRPIDGAKTMPWRHQAQAYWFAHDSSSTLLDMGMGTGKTKVVLDLCSRMGRGDVLVLCPLSVIPVWPRQVKLHGWDSVQFSVTTLLPKLSVAKKRDLAVKSITIRSSGVRIFICNYESAWREPLASWFLDRFWDLVVLDESHKIKTHNSKISKYCAKLREQATKRLCLTGTPMPHSPTDIFAQFRFLDPAIFGTNWTAFQARYVLFNPFGMKSPQGRPLQVVGYQNEEELAKKIDRITYRARTEDVLDLPETLDVRRYFQLGPEESRAYRTLYKDFIAKVKGGEIVASNALTKVLRLAQVTGGFARTQDGETVHIGDSKKKLLGDVLDDIGPTEPVVVFCRFHEDLNAALEAGKSAGREVRELSGRKNELQGDMWRKGNGNLLAVQIQSGGHGIDLTRARYCIYYGVDYSLGNFEQSKARIHRPGQTCPVTYIYLIGEGTVDEDIYDSLDRKKDVVQGILDKVA
jgi:SNF2 family DNA or RNA helicase